MSQRSLSLVWILWLCVVLPAIGQDQLLLLKSKTSAKKVEIVLGDKLKLKTLKGEKMKGFVIDISPESIRLTTGEYPLAELEYIRTFNPFLKGLGKSLETGSVFLVSIFIVNGFIHGGAPLLTQSGIIIISSLMASGIIFELLGSRTHRLENYRT